MQQTLSEYYQSQGQALPSLESRAGIYQGAGLGSSSDYISQNKAGDTNPNNTLLAYLQGQGATKPVNQTNPTQPLGITPPVNPPDTGSGTVLGANGTAEDINAYITSLTPIKSEAQNNSDALTERVNALLGSSTGQQQSLINEEKNRGVDVLKNSLADINSQLGTRTAEYNVLQAANQGKPITMNSIIGNERQILNAKAADIGLLNAQALGIQGRIDAAQASAKQAVDLKYAPILEEIDIKMKQLKLLEPKLNAEEKIRAEAQSQLLEKQKEEVAASKSSENALRSALLDQMKKYPAAGVSLTDTLEQANAKIKSSSAIYKDDLKSSPGSGNSNPVYNGIISTVLASGKFTKDQASVISNAISSGQDPLTVVKNNAKNIMTGATATKLESYENSLSAMVDLQSALKDYYLQGGKTGLFTGNLEKVQNKLGLVNDPNLVQVATQIAVALQAYRNAISGTAYSNQEGKDIASIFPGITKGEILNNAVTAGRIAASNNTIDGIYRNTLGTAYDSLKIPSPTTKSQITEDQSKKSVVDYVRANPMYDYLVNQAFKDNPSWTYGDVMTFLQRQGIKI